jgi:hypothetical protein
VLSNVTYNQYCYTGRKPGHSSPLTVKSLNRNFRDVDSEKTSKKLLRDTRYMPNEEILIHANTHRQLLNAAKLKASYLKHILRDSNINLSHRKNRGEKRTTSQIILMAP